MHPSNPVLLTRPQPKIVASSPPTVSYVGTYSTSGSGTSQITATIDIGNPAYIATRRVILALSAVTGSTNIVAGTSTINSATVTQSTTLANGASASNGVEFYSAVVSSGTTSVPVVLNFSGTMFGVPIVHVFTCDNSRLNSAIPATSFHQDTSGATLDTTTVATQSGGFMIACVWAGGGAGPTITSSTETFTSDYSNSADMVQHVNNTAANASSSVSTSGAPGGGFSGLGLAAWR